MTDRSSQPTSSGDKPSLTIQKNSKRHITVTLGKKITSGNITSDATSTENKKADVQGVSNSSSLTINDEKSTISASSKDNTTKTVSKSSTKTPLSTIEKKTLPPISHQIKYPDSHKPAVLHALFDPKRIKTDPTRPLTDIPEPAPREVLKNETTQEIFSRFGNDEHHKYLLKSTVNTDKKIKIYQNTNKGANTESPKYLSASNSFITQADKRKHEEAQLQSTIFDEGASKWELIQSPSLADHLALLSAGGLVEIPKSFYYNTSIQPLLTSIKDMKLVDISQVQITIGELLSDASKGITSGLKGKKVLTRKGMVAKRKLAANNKLSMHKRQAQQLPTADDIHNIELASEWEAILYPDRYDSDAMGHSNVSTDIMATSVTLHALAQCPMRKSINYKLTATDIAKYLRSYLLSQCNLMLGSREHLKHIHIYAGHVLVVAKMLGWQMECITENNELLAKVAGKQKGEVVFNISSRCGLFTRYPLLDEYYTNGWNS